jgi:hypothetical protein
MIIGFTGPAGCGKSTAAQILQESGWRRISFADPLRRLARRIHPEWCDDIFEHGNKDRIYPPTGYSPRELLRTLADEIKTLCPGAFVRAMGLELDRLTMPQHATSVVIDDVRYEAEANLVRARGGWIVHVKRDGIRYRRDHSSEEPLPFAAGDLAIHNYGDTAALAQELSALVTRVMARDAAA